MNMRKKAGSLTSMVASKRPPFFFNLRLKGEIKIDEEQRRNALREAGRLDHRGNQIDQVKIPDCPIDKSLSVRQKGTGGSVTVVVPNREKRED